MERLFELYVLELGVMGRIMKSFIFKLSVACFSVAILAGWSADASAWNNKTVTGLVGVFHVQPGEDVGVEIMGDRGMTLIRLCQPTQIGVDVNYYLYHRLNKAQSENKPVKIIYNERWMKDPVTGRNKLCLIELIY